MAALVSHGLGGFNCGCPGWFFAPFRSLTSAVVIATACGKPCVSTAKCLLIPDTFLPAS